MKTRKRSSRKHSIAGFNNSSWFELPVTKLVDVFDDDELCKKYNLIGNAAIRKTLTEKFTCRKCQTSFQSGPDFNKHCQDMHKYRCKICSFQPSNQLSLDCHMEAVHFNKNLKCHVCSKTYRNDNEYRLHLFSHEEIESVEKEAEPSVIDDDESQGSVLDIDESLLEEVEEGFCEETSSDEGEFILPDSPVDLLSMTKNSNRVEAAPVVELSSGDSQATPKKAHQTRQSSTPIQSMTPPPRLVTPTRINTPTRLITSTLQAVSQPEPQLPLVPPPSLTVPSTASLTTEAELPRVRVKSPTSLTAPSAVDESQPKQQDDLPTLEYMGNDSLIQDEVVMISDDADSDSPQKVPAKKKRVSPEFPKVIKNGDLKRDLADLSSACRCTICSKTFLTLSDAFEHMKKTHIADAAKQVENGPQKFQMKVKIVKIGEPKTIKLTAEKQNLIKEINAHKVTQQQVLLQKLPNDNSSITKTSAKPKSTEKVDNVKTPAPEGTAKKTQRAADRQSKVIRASDVLSLNCQKKMKMDLNQVPDFIHHKSPDRVLRSTIATPPIPNAQLPPPKSPARQLRSPRPRPVSRASKSRSPVSRVSVQRSPLQRSPTRCSSTQSGQSGAKDPFSVRVQLERLSQSSIEEIQAEISGKRSRLATPISLDTPTPPVAEPITVSSSASSGDIEKHIETHRIDTRIIPTLPVATIQPKPKKGHVGIIPLAKPLKDPAPVVPTLAPRPVATTTTSTTPIVAAPVVKPEPIDTATEQSSKVPQQPTQELSATTSAAHIKRSASIEQSESNNMAPNSATNQRESTTSHSTPTPKTRQFPTVQVHNPFEQLAQQMSSTCVASTSTTVPSRLQNDTFNRPSTSQSRPIQSNADLQRRQLNHELSNQGFYNSEGTSSQRSYSSLSRNSGFNNFLNRSTPNQFARPNFFQRRRAFPIKPPAEPSIEGGKGIKNTASKVESIYPTFD